MEKTDTIKPWPIKRRPLQIWVDPSFKQFIEREFPNAYNPERTRRIMDRLLGNETTKKKFKK